MALHRFPRAARRDAHRLVVVARRAARCERVAQPESIFVADAIRVIRECCRSLVRRDDEIRIVRVVALHTRRCDDFVADAVVGQIKQPAQVILVARDAFFHVRVAIGR